MSSSQKPAEFSSDLERLKYVYRERQGAGEFWDSRGWGPLDPAVHFQEMQFRNQIIQHLREKYENNLALRKIKVLEIGAGWGRNLYLFHELGLDTEQVHGIEYLPHFIAHGKSVMPSLSLRQGDAQKLDYTDGSFDLIICHTLFSAILDKGVQERILHECQRVLKSNGAILICDIKDGYPTSSVSESGTSVIFITPPGLALLKDLLAKNKLETKKVVGMGLMPKIRGLVLNGLLYTLLKGLGFRSLKRGNPVNRFGCAQWISRWRPFSSHFILIAEKGSS